MQHRQPQCVSFSRLDFAILRSKAPGGFQLLNAPRPTGRVSRFDQGRLNP